MLHRFFFFLHEMKWVMWTFGQRKLLLLSSNFPHLTQVVLVVFELQNLNFLYQRDLEYPRNYACRWAAVSPVHSCMRCILSCVFVTLYACSLWIVSSCSWCQQSISRTWSTCDMFPSGRSTSSPSSRSFAWLCSGSSSPLWLLLYSLSW